MDKKIKLVFPPEVYKAAKIKADQSGQTLEDWLMAIVLQQLESPDSIPALDWGRIDSRIDQRTIFLERRLDVLSDRLNQLCKHLPLELLASDYPPDSDPIDLHSCLDVEESNAGVAAASVTRLTA